MIRGCAIWAGQDVRRVVGTEIHLRGTEIH